MERTIRVTGKGNISVKPDTIRLRISLEDIFREYDDALRNSADSVELFNNILIIDCQTLCLTDDD